MTDMEIVALYWKRSEEAIACTMHKYGRYLLRLAQNILHIPEEAEECVNETYLSAWNQLPPDKPENLLPYLGRISRCLALNRYDFLTAQKRNVDFTVQLSELEDMLSTPDTPQQQYEYTELAAAISAFLRSQNKDTRDLFVRRYWYSDSIRDLAKRYGLRENTVKSRLLRTRQQLKGYLEKEGYAL